VATICLLARRIPFRPVQNYEARLREQGLRLTFGCASGEAFDDLFLE
jgi:hypothetical protein